MAMKLTDDKKGLIVKMLLEKNIYQTGMEFGFDKHYKDATAVKNAVYRIYQQALANPEKYFITPELVERVTAKMKERTPAAIVEQNTTLRERMDAEANMDLKDLVLSSRNKAFRILNKKLDRVGKNNKTIDEINLSTLATTVGILFDKGQIIQGEATENVAVLAKIKNDMTPEEAMASVLRMREAHQIDKDRTKKKK